MTRTKPLILRLPFAVADSHWRLERVFVEQHSRPWAECRALLPCFALSPSEKRFAKRLLARKRNVWLFRCNQRGFCGDFVAVDMSSAYANRRAVAMIELKDGDNLTFGGGGAGNQFHRASAAISELARTTGLIHVDARPTYVAGDGGLVIEWIETRGIVA